MKRYLVESNTRLLVAENVGHRPIDVSARRPWFTARTSATRGRTHEEPCTALTVAAASGGRYNTISETQATWLVLCHQ